MMTSSSGSVAWMIAIVVPRKKPEGQLIKQFSKVFQHLFVTVFMSINIDSACVFSDITQWLIFLNLQVVS